MQNLNEAELVTEELERILKSPPLDNSPSLCRFLRYVVEETLAGRSGSLKEYSLGVVVFERGEEFDPRLDPIVRVQARNLRVRLAQYYGAAGANDPVLIDLPKRTYVPVFRIRGEEESTTAVVSATPGTLPAVAPAVEMAAPASTDSIPAPNVPKLRISNTRIPAIAATVLVAVAASAALWPLKPHAPSRRSMHEPDPIAQDFYIRGRYLLDRQTETSLRESIACFENAAARDAQFAPAFAGLADAYNILAQYGYMAPREGMEKARAAAEHALDIDPSLAEAHVSLAAVIEAYDWNWAAAEHEYRHALELNPWLPTAHLWYGMFLRDQGRMKEALPELRTAAQLDPFSVLTNLNLAHAYMVAGNYTAAVEHAQRASELAPNLVTPEIILANAYRAESHPDEAKAALDKGLRNSADNPHALSALACAFARNGMREQSVSLLHQLDNLAKQRYVSPFDRGSVSLALGDDRRALDLLQEAFRQRSSGLIFLRDAKFSKGQNSPEFHLLIEKMHFAG